MKFRYWFGFLISLIFLYLFFRKIEFRSLWESLRMANYIYIIPAMIINLFTFVLRAKRWRYLLEPIKRIDTSSLFSATIIGFAANNLLPARIGELVRAYVIGKREAISKSSALATIVIERVFDGMMVILLLILVLFFPPFSDRVVTERLKGIGIFITITFGGAIVLLILLKRYTELFKRLIKLILSPFSERFSKRVLDIVSSFVHGLGVLSMGESLFFIIIYSVVMWGLIIMIIYSLYPAFGLDYLPFFSIFFLEVIIVFGVMLPSAPAYIGTFHFACATALGVMGVEPDKAKSFAIILWSVNAIPVTLIGLYYMSKENISFKEIKKEN